MLRDAYFNTPGRPPESNQITADHLGLDHAVLDDKYVGKAVVSFEDTY